MGETTQIGWTDHTANFWWGCQRVSPGCEHCYAEQLAVVRRKLPIWGPPKTTERKLAKGVWKDVVKWNRDAARAGVRRRVFVSSMADVFEDHPQVAPWRAEALALLERCTWLDVQLLTKRPQNILRMVPEHWRYAWPAHVWVGCTVEDQKRADERIPELLKVPARVRFLSCEPLLEAVDLAPWIGPEERVTPRQSGAAPFGSFCSVMACPEESPCPKHQRVSWVIVGGESGPHARPFALEWARSIVSQCSEAGVPVFVKQMGDHATQDVEVCPGGDGCGLDECAGGCRYAKTVTQRQRYYAHHGADPSAWPADLQVREFPGVHHA